MFMNSAQRLHHLFVQFQSVRPETSVSNNPPSRVDAWSTLFDRHDPAGQELDERAAESAMAVSQEISHLAVLLRNRGVLAELYSSQTTSPEVHNTKTANFHILSLLMYLNKSTKAANTSCPVRHSRLIPL